MSDSPQNPPLPPQGQVAAISKRRFSRTEGDPPEVSYVNAVEFTALGMDIFMDVGIVSPETINKAREQEQLYSAPLIVDFQVNARFGMTLQTAIMIHQRLTDVLKLLRTQTAAAVAEASKHMEEGGAK